LQFSLYQPILSPFQGRSILRRKVASNTASPRAISRFATGGKEALKAKGGEAATLLLEQIIQVPMPLVEEDERVTPSAVR